MLSSEEADKLPKLNQLFLIRERKQGGYLYGTSIKNKQNKLLHNLKMYSPWFRQTILGFRYSIHIRWKQNDMDADNRHSKATFYCSCAFCFLLKNTFILTNLIAVEMKRNRWLVYKKKKNIHQCENVHTVSTLLHTHLNRKRWLQWPPFMLPRMCSIQIEPNLLNPNWTQLSKHSQTPTKICLSCMYFRTVIYLLQNAYLN